MVNRIFESCRSPHARHHRKFTRLTAARAGAVSVAPGIRSGGLAARGCWLDGGMPAYDAFLLVSFGGPEGPDDVMPFLENVTAGRNVPRARLETVAEHYLEFGGVSPINEQCRELIAALDLPLPVYWGNRNGKPYLTDTVREMTDAGVRRALAFVTSAYRSYSSCRQYLEDIERARV